MKKLLMMTLLASSIVTGCSTVEPTDSTAITQYKITPLQSELGLTDRQAIQINTIDKSQQEKMKALYTTRNHRIVAVLTKEQATQFKQMEKQQAPARMSGRRGMSKPPEGMRQGNRNRSSAIQGQRSGRGSMVNRMKAELGLSNEQVTKIEAIEQDQRTQMQALYSERQNRIKQVLTAEQAAKFKQMRPQKMHGGFPR